MQSKAKYIKPSKANQSKPSQAKPSKAKQSQAKPCKAKQINAKQSKRSKAKQRIAKLRNAKLINPKNHKHKTPFHVTHLLRSSGMRKTRNWGRAGFIGDELKLQPPPGTSVRRLGVRSIFAMGSRSASSPPQKKTYPKKTAARRQGQAARLHGQAFHPLRALDHGVLRGRRRTGSVDGDSASGRPAPASFAAC